MNNGKSESFFLITSLRERNYGQKFPYYRQSWKFGEKIRRQTVLTINCMNQSENATEIRDQGEGRQQL